MDAVELARQMPNGAGSSKTFPKEFRIGKTRAIFYCQSLPGGLTSEKAIRIRACAPRYIISNFIELISQSHRF
jgi:hypothetical protein